MQINIKLGSSRFRPKFSVFQAFVVLSTNKSQNIPDDYEILLSVECRIVDIKNSFDLIEHFSVSRNNARNWILSIILVECVGTFGISLIYIRFLLSVEFVCFHPPIYVKNIRNRNVLNT